MTAVLRKRIMIMRILCLGNSFTYFNNLPAMLAAILGCEVRSHTRGGAYLAEQYNPETEMGAKTLAALQNEHWDYVVLQEQSNAPVLAKERFQKSVDTLVPLIRASGAQPVLYATWAYREGSEKLASTGLSYDEMDRGMYESYHEAAERCQTLTADVGQAFSAFRTIVDVYTEDDYHPSPAGSVLAAETIARTIMEAENKR